MKWINFIQNNPKMEEWVLVSELNEYGRRHFFVAFLFDANYATRYDNLYHLDKEEFINPTRKEVEKRRILQKYPVKLAWRINTADEISDELESEVCKDSVYHWMPLPEAPE